MEAFPNLLYVYNNFYDTSNTSKSLLKALKKIEDEDDFNKANNITNLWIKPVNFEKMAASIS